MSTGRSPVWPPIAAKVINEGSAMRSSSRSRSRSRSRSPSHSRSPSQSNSVSASSHAELQHFARFGTRRDSISASQAPILKDEIPDDHDEQDDHHNLFRQHMNELANEFDPACAADFRLPEPEPDQDIALFNQSLLNSNKKLVELAVLQDEKDNLEAERAAAASTLESATPGFSSNLGRQATLANLRKMPTTIYGKPKLQGGSSTNNMFLHMSRSLKRLNPFGGLKSDGQPKLGPQPEHSEESSDSSESDSEEEHSQLEDEQFLIQQPNHRVKKRRRNPWRVFHKAKSSAFQQHIEGIQDPKHLPYHKYIWHHLTHYVLIPDSYIMQCWYWSSILFVVYQLFLLPWTAFFQPDLLIHPAILTTDYLLDIFFLIDAVFVRLHLGFYNDWQQFQSDLTKIRHDCLYEQGILWDLIGLIPLELFAFIDPAFAFGTRLHGLYRLIRLARARRLFSHKLDSVHFYLRFLKLSVTGLVVIHFIGCFLYGLAEGESIIQYDLSDPANTGLDADKIFHIPWTQKAGIHEADLETRYVTSVYWVVVMFLTLGYGEITPSTNAEKLIVCFVLVSGVMFTSILLSVISMLIANSDRSAVRLEEGLDQIEGIFTAYPALPKRLNKELKEQYTSIWRVHKGFDMNEVLDDLPPKFNSRTKLFLHAALVQKVPWFSKSGTGFLIDIVRRLRPVLYLANEYIFKQGDAADCMYFLATGHARIFRIEPKKKETQRISRDSTAKQDEKENEDESECADPLKDPMEEFNIVFDKFVFPGQFFGELGIMFLEPRAASVLTVTNCEVCVLSKFDFKDVLHMHPKSAVAVIREAKARKRMDKVRDKKRQEAARAQKKRSAPAASPGVAETGSLKPADIPRGKLTELRNSFIKVEENKSQANPAPDQTPAISAPGPAAVHLHAPAPDVSSSHGSLRQLHDVHAAEFVHPHAPKVHQSAKASALILIKDLSKRLTAMEHKIAQQHKLEEIRDKVEHSQSQSHSHSPSLVGGSANASPEPPRPIVPPPLQEASSEEEEEFPKPKLKLSAAEQRPQLQSVAPLAEDSVSASPASAVSPSSAPVSLSVSNSLAVDSVSPPARSPGRKVILKSRASPSKDEEAPLKPPRTLPALADWPRQPIAINEQTTATTTLAPPASELPADSVSPTSASQSQPQRRRIRLSVGGYSDITSPANQAPQTSQTAQESAASSPQPIAASSSGAVPEDSLATLALSGSLPNSSPSKKAAADLATGRQFGSSSSVPLARQGSATPGARSTLFARAGGASLDLDFKDTH